ncbi:MAG: lysozyme inhibitor LprI family protein, partial [Spongiibacteraceae bacterium]
LALLLAAASAHALDCKNAVTTPDMNACAAREQKEVEADLNRVYQRVLKTVSAPKVRTQFVAAQRLWVKFREADCQTVYQQHADGSMRTLVYLGCMQNRATTRIKELEAFADGR